jgi:Holliday junction resolvase RusA-like endonuclease
MAISQAITVTLDKLPPSTNRLWRAHKGRVLMAAHYREWMDSAVASLIAQAHGHSISGPYGMLVRFVKPDRRKRDLSNNLKALEDAIVKAGLVRDDSDCQSIELAWVEHGPAVRVHIISTKERSGE